MNFVNSHKVSDVWSNGRKKISSFFNKINRFGQRNLEKEAIATSIKMEQNGIKGEMLPNTDTLLSKEELELTEKDRTPG
jgi:hypothetical protein